MLASLDARQLLRWQAAYLLDPWGGERADLNAATVSQTMIQMLSTGKGKPPDLAGLMPDFAGAWKKAKEQDEEQKAREKAREMKLNMMVFTARVGGTVR